MRNHSGPMARLPFWAENRLAVRTLMLVLAVSVAHPALAESVAGGAKGASKSAAKTVSAVTISDGELQERIQGKLSKAKAGAGKFTVRVTGGVAYLAGQTEIPQHKGAATRMAKSAGAKRVVNNITVSGGKDKVGALAGQKVDERPRAAMVR